MSKTITTILAALFLMTTAAAQEEDTAKVKPQFKVSLHVNSNLNYYGRTDSLRSRGIFPLAELWITPRIYVNAAPVFVSNAVQAFDYSGTVVTAGYQYQSEKWLNQAYLLKPLYEQSSQLVQSALKAQTGFSFSRLHKRLNATLGADLKFSDRVDVGLTAGLDHLIRKERADNSILVINPSLFLYAGTQQFSTTYYKKTKRGLLPRNAQPITENTNRFAILAYELTVPLVYAKNKVQVLLTPAFVVPRNLMQVPNRPDLSEQGRPTFYASAGVKYTF